MVVADRRPGIFSSGLSRQGWYWTEASYEATSSEVFRLVMWTTRYSPQRKSKSVGGIDYAGRGVDRRRKQKALFGREEGA